MSEKLTWTNIDDLGYALAQKQAALDPLAVSFTELRALVEALDDFNPEPDQNVNEQILEAIQHAWIEERQDIQADEDEPRYKPPVAYKPDN